MLESPPDGPDPHASTCRRASPRSAAAAVPGRAEALGARPRPGRCRVAASLADSRARPHRLLGRRLPASSTPRSRRTRTILRPQFGRGPGRARAGAWSSALGRRLIGWSAVSRLGRAAAARGGGGRRRRDGGLDRRDRRARRSGRPSRAADRLADRRRRPAALPVRSAARPRRDGRAVRLVAARGRSGSIPSSRSSPASSLLLGARRIGIGAWHALMDRAAIPRCSPRSRRIVRGLPRRRAASTTCGPAPPGPGLHPDPPRARRRAVAARGARDQRRRARALSRPCRTPT